MKIAILTFQFAYNYGAELQAYALKTHLISLGHSVDIIPYYPEHLKRSYSISPFEKNISIKHRAYNCLSYFRKHKQTRLFEQFKTELIPFPEFNDPSQIASTINKYDLLICGSDQIWNDNITGGDGTYYGKDILIPKITYAASIGTREISDSQDKNMTKYIQGFKNISVREESSRKLLNKYIKEVSVVSDPVFLLDQIEWSNVMNPVNIEKNYILLYLLEDDNELVKYTLDYAKENNLKIYEIHPTLSINHKGIRLLNNIGPKEFLYLFCNANAICTNSFHGVSFSIIFGKKLFHKPNSKSPDRTIDVLGKAGFAVQNKVCEYNLEHRITLMKDFILDSKNYLKKSITT